MSAGESSCEKLHDGPFIQVPILKYLQAIGLPVLDVDIVVLVVVVVVMETNFSSTSGGSSNFGFECENSSKLLSSVTSLMKSPRK